MAGMANGHPGPATQRARPGEPQPAPVSVPTDNVVSKRDLSSWWKTFKRNTAKRDEPGENLFPDRSTYLLQQQCLDSLMLLGRFAEAEFDQPTGRMEENPQVQALTQFLADLPETGIFGVPLQTSIRYANVAISLFDADGASYIYGYVPIVVAKCGVFLKEKATDIEGIFRLSGSEKRIKELRTAFNSPDRYGKGLDWTGYTVHDAANILRRYFNQLPEPIIPLQFYERFRAPLRGHQADAVGEMDGQSPSVGNFDIERAIREYQTLITELPPLNRQLLLYILDLLAVFASKSDLNKMTTPNLAAIFQPGLLSHPSHDMAPPEYRLSQDVLIFLIENQDHFLIGMQGTEADAQTVQDVQSGPPTPHNRTPSTPSRSKTVLGRSGSNSSAGAESIRQHGGLRRNLSVSSRHSNRSPTTSPITPSFGAATGSGGVHRSATLPSSRRSPITQSPRIARDRVSEQERVSEQSELPKSPDNSGPPTPTAVTAPTTPFDSSEHTPFVAANESQLVAPEIIPQPPSEEATPLATLPEQQPSFPPSSINDSNTQLVADAATPKAKEQSKDISGPAQTTPESSSARFLGALLGKSPGSDDTDGKDGRKPKKLQKRRPNSSNPSAASSSNSLDKQINQDPEVYRRDRDGPPSPLHPLPHPASAASPGDQMLHPSGETPQKFKPGISPSTSFRSHSTVTEFSEAAPDDEAVGQSEAGDSDRKPRRWRGFSTTSSSKGGASTATGTSGSLNVLGSNEPAQRSHTSVNSSGEAAPRRSFQEGPVNWTGTDASETTMGSRGETSISHATGSTTATEDKHKTSFLERVKNKLHSSSEERKAEKLAEKQQRAKSPDGSGHGHGSKSHQKPLGPSGVALLGLGGSPPRSERKSGDVGRRGSEQKEKEKAAMAMGPAMPMQQEKEKDKSMPIGAPPPFQPFPEKTKEDKEHVPVSPETKTVIGGVSSTSALGAAEHAGDEESAPAPVVHTGPGEAR
ncbi:RhoGAP-domain-containing protein [Aulographum hederae CBS 113979]|uniref:RhoGAP-domain-containing protein n=1 Tax=Aulographum hederae CBS 113979 TaxID=1176131 RepID=A0A6G1H9Q7_9PEZI|nr:RhoGAP-domain-containing protein [Aulographum hederae CBS 113979]